jgi:pyruvate/2-oxoglutarate dehydrogenase complex dihydrolipoamide dehydrogenase (E3) component
MGSAKFVGPKTLEVSLPDGTTRVIRGDKVIIGTGTHAIVPDLSGLRESNPMTHIEALELDRVPEHLLVLGGGYIGLELAQAMRRFGSRVTVIERNDRLASREDEDVCEAVHQLFEDEGIDILTNAHSTRVEGTSGQSVKLHFTRNGSPASIEATDILVATGRTPNTQGIGLDLAGVELTAAGYIKVNERLETTAPQVWAIGECAGSPQFTHVSVDDFRIVRDNMAGGNRRTDDRLVPYVMFTDPPLARVGLSEGEAQRKAMSVRVGRLPMSHVLRTAATDETEGFMKVLVSAQDDRILGFTMIGSEAGEVMAAIQTAMLAELPYPKLRDAVITHLTIAEGLGPLLAGVPPRVA